MNNKVTVIAGPSFNNSTCDDPNNSLIDNSSNTFATVISLDYTQSSWNRTLITQSGVAALSVKLEISNCGEQSRLKFNNQTTALNALLYTTNPTEDAFTGTFFFYDDLIYSNDLDLKVCSPNISSFSPTTVPAGTYYSGGPMANSLLTISGLGFGNQIGQVLFSGVDSTVGQAGTNKSDIVSWTDNEIQLHIPHFVDSFPLPTSLPVFPGSGLFEVENGMGYKGVSNQELNINYSLAQLRGVSPAPSTKTRVDLFDVNGLGGYTIRLGKNITNHPNPMYEAIIKKAIRDWTCSTSINWVIGSDTTIGQSDDLVTNITFATGSIGNVLGVTAHHAGQCSSAPPYYRLSKDFDLIFYEDFTLAPFDGQWFFDTLGNPKPEGTFDFYDAILHELGHGGLLKHVTGPTTTLMFAKRDTFAVSGTSRQTIDSNAEDGGEEVVFKSVNNNFSNCGTLLPMVEIAPDSCIAGNGMQMVGPLRDISIHPNPFISEVWVEYELLNPQVMHIIAYDLYGRIVYDLGEELCPKGISQKRLDFSNLSPGLFLLDIKIDEMTYSKKIIKIR